MPEFSSARFKGRVTSRHRRRFRAQADKLYTLPEMLTLLGISRRTYDYRRARNDGSVPPGFQPCGPGTPWRFSEASYLKWLDEQERQGK